MVEAGTDDGACLLESDDELHELDKGLEDSQAIEIEESRAEGLADERLADARLADGLQFCVQFPLPEAASIDAVLDGLRKDKNKNKNKRPRAVEETTDVEDTNLEEVLAHELDQAQKELASLKRAKTQTDLENEALRQEVAALKASRLEMLKQFKSWGTQAASVTKVHVNAMRAFQAGLSRWESEALNQKKQIKQKET
jgi:hypothetical protein